ncbi:preprotein translocase subunit YajC [Hymenobacter sp. 5516J-16]|uniref:preprotein translocase subunit YajC n=1 Tax=Hymenobacter sp. 5516J-16 TaxID=2932253 RepID=UPI00293ECE73|nr:preprotein translocase subunit YajC [Hymenobacter sp. 5516J-16]
MTGFSFLPDATAHVCHASAPSLAYLRRPDFLPATRGHGSRDVLLYDPAQQRRSAEAKKFRAALAKGANVVTIGGLHGRVVDVNEDTVTVEVDKGVRLRFDRSAIAREVVSKNATPAA